MSGAGNSLSTTTAEVQPATVRAVTPNPQMNDEFLFRTDTMDSTTIRP